MFEKIPTKNEGEIILELRKQLEEAQEKIRQLEENRHVDILTGLPNNAELELAKLIKELNCFPDGPLSSIVAVYLDLNKFKQINDVHGHAVGDQAILALVDKVQSLVKRTDTVYRLHGDEFAVILPVDKKITEQEVIRIFQRLYGGLSKFDMPAKDPNKKNIELSASMGYAVFKNGDTAKTLMDKADKSMYEAKRESKEMAA